MRNLSHMNGQHPGGGGATLPGERKSPSVYIIVIIIITINIIMAIIVVVIIVINLSCYYCH